MTAAMVAELRQEVRGLGDEKIAARSQSFFKTGKCEDANGDIFSGILPDDRHDLIYKTSDWLLRVVSKQNLPVEEKVLRRHCWVMPCTLLRCGVEKIPQQNRLDYLQGRI